MTPDRLDEAAALAQVAPDNLEILGRCNWNFQFSCDFDACGFPPEIRRYFDFERGLRFAIAALRMDKSGVACLMPTLDSNPDAAKVAASLSTISNPFERERLLDAARWELLDEIGQEHRFDFIALCIYRIRLTLLAARIRRDPAEGRKAFGRKVEDAAAAFHVNGGR
ncbi:MAG: hypothetical protein MJ025_07030 [Victivallaceae bacterium]|nr:hypothetical protein [Victivallaceae bacterium]